MAKEIIKKTSYDRMSDEYDLIEEFIMKVYRDGYISFGEREILFDRLDHQYPSLLNPDLEVIDEKGEKVRV